VNGAAVVIPVYNHGRAVAGVVRAALDLGWPVVVVDDGSEDHTPEVLAAIGGITRLRHAVNRGKGAALVSGLEAAAARAVWAVTLDGDGQHDPADAPRLLEEARTWGQGAGRPLVIGRRRDMASQAPWSSRFGRGFSNFWVRCAGGPILGDSQSGFRAYPLPESLALGVRAGGYQFEIEILVKAAWRGMAVIEVPVAVDYHPPGGRVSHFRPGRDFWRNTCTFARLITQRVLLSREARRRM
jgi:glycosyltransferase involved in cell wall biosynthesis